MFQRFMRAGGQTAHELSEALQFASHDAYIAEGLRKWLISHDPRLVGIMGGHGLSRDQDAYREVAILARQLTRSGYVIATGGGPGAMEAGHLGAASAHRKDSVLDDALSYLALHAPKLPDLRGMLDPAFEADPAILEEAHNWLLPAHSVLQTLLEQEVGVSLAVPTWLYGHEPIMPFASAYAKYFNNSIREEALVTRSRAGIVYARGGGGTIREVFQDLEENYYQNDVTKFTPMIFFDKARYWASGSTSDSPGVKLDEVVPDVLRLAKKSAGKDPQPFIDKVVFTTDLILINKLLDEHSSVARREMRFMVGNIGSDRP